MVRPWIVKCKYDLHLAVSNDNRSSSMKLWCNAIGALLPGTDTGFVIAWLLHAFVLTENAQCCTTMNAWTNLVSQHQPVLPSGTHTYEPPINSIQISVASRYDWKNSFAKPSNHVFVVLRLNRNPLSLKFCRASQTNSKTPNAIISWCHSLQNFHAACDIGTFYSNRDKMKHVTIGNFFLSSPHALLGSSCSMLIIVNSQKRLLSAWSRWLLRNRLRFRSVAGLASRDITGVLFMKSWFVALVYLLIHSAPVRHMQSPLQSPSHKTLRRSTP